MSYRVINEVLDSVVAGIEFIPTIIQENTTISTNKEEISDPYTRTSLLPAETNTLTIGPSGWDEFQGLYQIDLFFPSTDGVKGSNFMVDEIIKAFPKGSLITQEGINVRIVNYWREPSIESDNLYQTPVIIRWDSFIQRP